MTYKLRTNRLGFRQWRESDGTLFRELNADPLVMEFFEAPMTFEETDAMMKRMANHIDEYGFGFFAVDDLSTATFVGFIGLGYPRFQLGFGKFMEIGWRLLPSHWGKGLATEGAKALLHYGFESLGVDCVYAMTTIGNKRSERVMQKLGMQFDQYFEHPLLAKDSPLREHVLYRIAFSQF